MEASSGAAMSVFVSISEARRGLGHLLDRVGHGERITITRRGVPVAELRPIRVTREEVRATIEALRRFRNGQRLDGLSLRELIEGGRR
jgi:prevent-host-death family protein